MKKLFLIILSVVICYPIFAQNRFGLKEVTDKNRTEVENIIKNIKTFQPSAKSRAAGVTPLPTFVDNSTGNDYFPGVVSQLGGSCGCASCVHYQYTYEYNYLYKLDADYPENVYGYMFIWNLLNDGGETGTFPWDVYDAMKWYGVIPESSFMSCGLTKPYTELPDGFDKYQKGLPYSVDSYYKIKSDEVGQITTMKQYLYDHADGSTKGGVIQFSAYADPLTSNTYSGDSKTNYTAIIPKFGTTGMHSMIIVGYDDDIWYDYNQDGNKDNDETGAFICINSWGEDWGDNGRFYAPYRTFTTAMEQGEGGTGNGGKYVYIVSPKKKEITLEQRFLIKYDSRNDLSFEVGKGNLNANTLTPTKKVLLCKASQAASWEGYKVLQELSSDVGMRGTSDDNADILHFSYDISQIKDYSGDYYYCDIKSSSIGSEIGTGKIILSYLIDYSDANNPITYFGDIQTNELKSDHTSRIIYRGLSDLPIDGDVQIVPYTLGDEIMLEVRAKDSKYVSVDLLAKDGQKLKALIDETVEAGLQYKEFDVSYLCSKDIPYYIRTNVSGIIQYTKIVF
ncbi:MAG: C1 family peptidase [Bacteroidales bacterium]